MEDVFFAGYVGVDVGAVVSGALADEDDMCPVSRTEPAAASEDEADEAAGALVRSSAGKSRRDLIPPHAPSVLKKARSRPSATLAR